MSRRIGIFGSTGSIGVQAMEMIERNGNILRPVFLSCGQNVPRLVEQIRLFKPEAVCVRSESDAEDIKCEFPDLTVFSGPEGLNHAASEIEFDVMFNSLVGISGLAPTLAFLKAAGNTGKILALSNKETLVTGGRFVTEAAMQAGISIIPVDSEHSAIFQCLRGNEPSDVKKIILTGSGGPFRGRESDELAGVTPEQALAHPNWNMGAKITIDSATMMNKAFEIIEARWLFALRPEQIDVVIHPQSIAHSFVEYVDGAIMSQLGAPDMRVPISYAFSVPARWDTDVSTVDLSTQGTLDFESPSGFIKRGLDLAYHVLGEESRGFDSPGVVLNGANEELVAMFLSGDIGFTAIIDTIEKVVTDHKPQRMESPTDIFELDKESRAAARRIVEGKN